VAQTKPGVSDPGPTQGSPDQDQHQAEDNEENERRMQPT